jgi:hypothetical protein
MPFSYTISSASKLIYIEIRDSTDLPELEKAAAEIVSDRQFKAEYDVIFDAREIKYTPLAGDVKEVVKLVLQSKDTIKNKKIALVVSGDFLYDIAKMTVHYITQKIDIAIKAFDDIDRANQWLGKKK